MIVFCDIDGTISDPTHRKHYVECPRAEQDWDAFYSPDRVMADPPINVGLGLARLISTADEFYFLTGRPERLRQATIWWLTKYFDLGSIALLMRADGDRRKAFIYKNEMIEDRRRNDRSLIFVDDDIRNESIYAKFGMFLKAPECWSVLR
jgi:hypothetical protein